MSSEVRILQPAPLPHWAFMAHSFIIRLVISPDSSGVEHFHGKEGVGGSNPPLGSRKIMAKNELVVSKDKKALGVAGGIAEYYQADPAWVRIVGLIFIIATGIIPGLILYFLLGKTVMVTQKDSKKK